MERKLSVHFSDEPLDKALFTLSEMAEFNLLYNASILPPGSAVTYRGENKTLSEIFSVIIPSDLAIKITGNNVLLLKKPAAENTKKEIVIEGEVFDLQSGTPIRGAAVLEMKGAQSKLTDAAGNFTFRIIHQQEDLQFAVRKAGYQDTVFLLMPQTQKVYIYLQDSVRQIRDELAAIEISAAKPKEVFAMRELIIPEPLPQYSEKKPEHTQRDFQLSLIPGISTNKKIASNVENQVSVNIVGGYNYGVVIFECGGGFNINKKDVGGAQIAGVTNWVGGEINGLQLSGGMNVAKNLDGVQLSGGANIADSISGLQLSSLFNKCRHQDGVQLSAAINVSDTMDGVQIGLINRSKHQNGFQFGIINITHSSEGLSIGLLNFVTDKKFGVFPLFWAGLW